MCSRPRFPGRPAASLLLAAVLPWAPAAVVLSPARRQSFEGPVVSHTCSCLAIEPKDGQRLRVAAQKCVHGSLLQTWSFDSESKQVVGRVAADGGGIEERCLDVAEGGALALASCDDKGRVGASQQWLRDHDQGLVRSVFLESHCLEVGEEDGLPQLAPCGTSHSVRRQWSLLVEREKSAPSIQDGALPVVTEAGNSEFNGPYIASGTDNGQPRFVRVGSEKETLNFANGWWILAKDYSGCWYRAPAGQKEEFPGPFTVWQACPNVNDGMLVGREPAPHVALSSVDDVPAESGEGEFSTCPMGCTCPVMFDCDVDLQSWFLGWSDRKKDYCCNSANETMRHYICPTTSTTTFAPLVQQPLDCMAGLANWRFGWSDVKQKSCCQQWHQGFWAITPQDLCQDCYYTWCCANGDFACTTTFTTTSVIFMAMTTQATPTMLVATETTTLAPIPTVQPPPPAHCPKPSAIVHVMFGDECVNVTVLESGTCCATNCPANTFGCVTKGGSSVVGQPCCNDGVLDPPTYWCSADASCNTAFRIEQAPPPVLLDVNTKSVAPPPEQIRAMATTVIPPMAAASMPDAPQPGAMAAYPRGPQEEAQRSYSAPSGERSQTCSDLEYTGVRFRSGPRATCADLVNYCNHKSSVLTKKVHYACQKTCGLCALVADTISGAAEVGACQDKPAHVEPVLTLGGKTVTCAQAMGFCNGHQDSDFIAEKCPATCGRCTPAAEPAAQIQVPPSREWIRREKSLPPDASSDANSGTRIDSNDAPTQCSRRRRFGMCYSRRRRDFV